MNTMKINILKENNYQFKKANTNIHGFLISESGLNRLKTNLENGGIIISANLSDFPDDESEDIYKEYDKWLELNALNDSDEHRKFFLNIHNKNGDVELENDIKKYGLSYSKVYDGYHGNNGVIDSYEPSFVVYSKDKNGNLIDFNILFDFAIKMCKKYFQNSVYIQPPNKKPYYVNKNGIPISKPGKKETTYNRLDSENYTTIKRKKNNSQRFSADIEFESFRVKHLTNFEKMRQKQYGEVILE